MEATARRQPGYKYTYNTGPSAAFPLTWQSTIRRNSASFQSKINRPASAFIKHTDVCFCFNTRRTAMAPASSLSGSNASSNRRSKYIIILHFDGASCKEINMTYTTSLEMIQETIALGRRQDALSAGRSFLQMTGASRPLRLDAHRQQRDVR